MKIDIDKATAMDYYNLGKVYYNLQDFIKADTMLAMFNKLQPDYIQGFVWRARTKSNLDPDSKLGLAKPVFETILEKTASDTVKYQKDRMEALYYLAFYYFQQFNISKQKDREAGIKSMDYCNRIIAIDPNDEKAIKAKQILDVMKRFIN
jgi:tetratricopeptide (TPR) repeat protein